MELHRLSAVCEIVQGNPLPSGLVFRIGDKRNQDQTCSVLKKVGGEPVTV